MLRVSMRGDSSAPAGKIVAIQYGRRACDAPLWIETRAQAALYCAHILEPVRLRAATSFRRDTLRPKGSTPSPIHMTSRDRSLI
jgi:hypothetical protein